MDDSTEFSDTTGELARTSATTPATVRVYAALGLLEYRVASNGMRLFRKGQAERVREILAERLAGRGRKRA